MSVLRQYGASVLGPEVEFVNCVDRVCVVCVCCVNVTREFVVCWPGRAPARHVIVLAVRALVGVVCASPHC